jgi:hypothetical protein
MIQSQVEVSYCKTGATFERPSPMTPPKKPDLRSQISELPFVEGSDYWAVGSTGDAMEDAGRGRSHARALIEVMSSARNHVVLGHVLRAISAHDHEPAAMVAGFYAEIGKRACG